MTTLDIQPLQKVSLEFNALRALYRAGDISPIQVAAEIIQRISARGDDGVWIHKVPPNAIMDRARELEALSADRKSKLPLYGLPFSVKDCIDVAGLPTTSACPAYAYTPDKSNLAVARALAAGAILIGKTNMDQFATGVVGVRTPYGIARNPFDSDYIPGGSSSGAAVSVSSGLCSFAFGTDTGGSGRVPASYNNIVGLKPTLGVLSRANMVNASRSFDTISIYALTVEDSIAVLDTCRGVDADDPLGRSFADVASFDPGAPLRVAVTQQTDLEFFGNADAKALYLEGIDELARAGHQIAEVPFETIFETSKMMFFGPWIAERYAAVGDFVENHPRDVDPIVYDVIMSSKKYSAADAFAALDKLRTNTAKIHQIFEDIDVMAVPTVGTVYTINDVAADPIATNASNGLYLNFVSMADLAAIAVPNGFLPNGIPMGMTFVARPFSDYDLAAFAQNFYPSRVSFTGTGKVGENRISLGQTPDRR